MDASTYEEPTVVELGSFSEDTGVCYSPNDLEVFLPFRGFVSCF